MFFEKCIAVAHDGAEQNQKVQVILVLRIEPALDWRSPGPPKFADHATLCPPRG